MKYRVRLPITGIVTVQVEASSEKEAIEKAFTSEKISDDLEWEPVSKIVAGNVFHGMLNEAEACEIESNENE